MHDKITLGVLRDLENRRLDLPDDSPMAVAAHVRRGDALHEVLDGDASITVLDWGNTDDEKPHEFVLVVLSAVAPTIFQHVVVPGVKWVGDKLAEKLVESAISEVAKHLVAKIWPRVKTSEMQSVTITLPVRDTTRVILQSEGKTVSISVTADSGFTAALNNIEVHPTD